MAKKTPVEKAPVETEAVPLPKKKKSGETLLGTLLFLVMILFVLACLGVLAWGAYAVWQDQKQEKAEPSIVSLTDEPIESVQEEVSKEEDKEESVPVSDEALVSAKAATISVMNGGAAKGTAGTASEFLKEKGFTKVTAGNTIGNFTGTTVYYDSKSQKEAEALQKVLVEKYPNAKAAPAESANKETATSPITVIFGK